MPDPRRSVVVVARSSVGIVGRCFLMSPAHVEGIWVHRVWRNGQMMKRLVTAIEEEAQKEGIKKLMAYAHGDEMADYINRLGYVKMPLTVWSKDICRLP